MDPILKSALPADILRKTWESTSGLSTLISHASNMRQAFTLGVSLFSLSEEHRSIFTIITETLTKDDQAAAGSYLDKDFALYLDTIDPNLRTVCTADQIRESWNVS